MVRRNVFMFLVLLLVSFFLITLINNENSEQDLLLIPKININSDMDKDGINDLEDIILGARAEVSRQPHYQSAYYRGGYPPENEGVCSDLVWRAFLDAGIDLKNMVDEDIKNNVEKYPRVQGRPDPNIDFRRVQNLIVFFQRHGQSLPIEVIPKDIENLKKWQGGDIVVFGHPLWHIAIVSDKRRNDGVPFIIHNCGPTPREEDYLMDWSSPLIGHYRYPKTN